MKKILPIAVLAAVLLTGSASAGYIEPLREMTVLSAMGIDSVSDVRGGYVVSLEKGQAMELSDSMIVDFLNSAEEMTVKRRIIKNPFCGVAIVLRTDEGEKTYFINSGVQVGKYGEDNYLCYSTAEENETIGAIYASFMSSANKYSCSVFNINDKTDYLIFPNEQWAVSEVLYGASNSLIPYEITQSFGKAISREEFCILVANFLAVCGNYNSLDSYFAENDIAYLSNYFSDTKGCDNSINMLFALGVINGKSEDTFCPGDALTREETAVILKNAACAAGMDIEIGNANFSDMAKVSDWARDAVKAAGSNGIMSAIENSEFRPKAYLTTEQAVAGINKLFKLRK